jgi:two-component system sensor kinase FixL
MDWRSQFDMFMPHGMCLLWRPGLMSLHVISDALIALAYFTIPVSILRFVRGRRDLRPAHRALAFLLAAFIALCGFTHVVGIIVLWMPVYLIEGWIKAATAIASVATAGWLVALVPLALEVPSVKAMQREVAARRETESRLRAAERVIEVMPGLIHVKDRSGRMLVANQATLDLIGKRWADVAGRRDVEVLAGPPRADTAMDDDRRVVAAIAGPRWEEIIVQSDAGPRVYLSTKAPFEGDDEGAGGVVGLSIDVTERSEVAKDHLHGARRTAMGDMAAALAHEINQPLAAISMYLAGSLALLQRESYQGPLTRSLGLATDQCLRAGEIIRRVRSFVSGGGEVRRRENLTRLVDEACGLALLGSRDSGVVVSRLHDQAELPVIVDKAQIEQVVVNLVRNALEAMGDAKGMSLRVTSGYRADGMARVCIADSGPGVSAEVVHRLFEPFVSTKGVKGMGVGLSICRTIVEGHGGKIWADSDTREGVTFCFTLPSAAGETAP